MLFILLARPPLRLASSLLLTVPNPRRCLDSLARFLALLALLGLLFRWQASETAAWVALRDRIEDKLDAGFSTREVFSLFEAQSTGIGLLFCCVDVLSAT